MVYTMEKKLIAKTKIKREKGFIYFTGTDELGNLTIMSATSGKKVEVNNEE